MPPIWSPISPRRSIEWADPGGPRTARPTSRHCRQPAPGHADRRRLGSQPRWSRASAVPDAPRLRRHLGRLDRDARRSGANPSASRASICTPSRSVPRRSSSTTRGSRTTRCGRSTTTRCASRRTRPSSGMRTSGSTNDSREALADIAPPNAIVWVHDYQLQLVPKMLRAQRERRHDRVLPAHPVPAVRAVLPPALAGRDRRRTPRL